VTTLARVRGALPRGPALWWLVVLIAAGAYAGELYARAVGSHFAEPRGLDPETWQVVSPGMDGSLMLPELGRGTMVVDGALTISEHLSFTADKVGPKDPSPVGRLELSLAADSDAVAVQLFADDSDPMTQSRNLVLLAPDRFNTQPSARTWRETAAGGEYRIVASPAGLVLHHGAESLDLGISGDVRVEVSVHDGTARILAMRALDHSGRVLAEGRFDRDRVSPWIKDAGTRLGMLLGLALWWLGVRRGPGAVIAGGLLALPPLAVARIDAAAWLALGEHAYLTRSPPWDLATVVTGLAAIPLLLHLCSSLPTRLDGASPPAPGPSRGLWAVWIGLLLATGWAADPALEALPWSLLGLAFLGAPLWIASRSPLSGPALLVRDLPALAAVAGLGWHFGLGLAVLWRLGWLMASARVLIGLAPRAAADYGFLLLLMVPVSLELALRGTYLDRGWHPEHMTLDLGTDGSALDTSASWEGRCGQGDQDHTVLFVGGSSTGGVLQFKDQPELFFPGRTHARLCEGLDPSHSLATYNFGRGAVDTHVIARSFAPVMDRLEPQLVVMYVAVNDLLSRFQRLTRRQREEKMAQWRGGLRGLQALSSWSRLVTGTGLVLRSREQLAGEQVQDVPVADARLNHQSVAEQTAARGVTLLVITEYVRRDTVDAPSAGEDGFEDYAAMQRDVAEGHEHVHYLDVWPALRQDPDERVLIDSNHLTRYGSNRLGEILTPVVAELAAIPYDDPASPGAP